jgi:nucleolin
MNRFFSSTRQALQKLYVGNLNWQITDDALRKTFSKHGELVDAFIVRDRLSGKSRGFGFVEFAKKQEAENAREELDGSQFEGRTMKVNLADSKPPRSPRSA